MYTQYGSFEIRCSHRKRQNRAHTAGSVKSVGSTTLFRSLPVKLVSTSVRDI